jgi:hypothetical protein
MLYWKLIFGDHYIIAEQFLMDKSKMFKKYRECDLYYPIPVL